MFTRMTSPAHWMHCVISESVRVLLRLPRGAFHATCARQCVRARSCSARIIHGSERVKCGGRPRAAWSSARTRGQALIIKNTFAGRISAASVVGYSLQGHIQDNRTEEKFANTAQKNPEDGFVRC